jgi:hypothetical protein
MGHGWEMGCRVRQIDKEWRVGLGLPLHETDSAICQVSIDQWSIVKVVRTRLFRGTSLRALQYKRCRNSALGKAFQGSVNRLVGGIRDTVPFLKSLVCREASFGTPEMPFSVHSRGVTDLREHLCHRDFPLHQTVDTFS